MFLSLPKVLPEQHRKQVASAMRQAYAAFAELSSKLAWPHLLEFVVARVAEASLQIYRAIDGHFAQFDEA